eukprot:SAG22_NODE_2019_length_3129_cov_1.934653_5_plen_67_part_00
MAADADPGLPANTAKLGELIFSFSAGPDAGKVRKVRCWKPPSAFLWHFHCLPFLLHFHCLSLSFSL